jgi:hypothetical protein
MSNAGRQIINSLLDAINRSPDMAEVFDNKIFRIVWHRPVTG